MNAWPQAVYLARRWLPSLSMVVFHTAACKSNKDMLYVEQIGGPCPEDHSSRINLIYRMELVILCTELERPSKLHGMINAVCGIIHSRTNLGFLDVHLSSLNRPLLPLLYNLELSPALKIKSCIPTKSSKVIWALVIY